MSARSIMSRRRPGCMGIAALEMKAEQLVLAITEPTRPLISLSSGQKKPLPSFAS